MRFRAGRMMVVLGLTFVLGLHWPLLQAVAWVNMAVAFSRTETLQVALQKTLDGKHPCNLCAFVQKGKKTEGEKQSSKDLLKKEFVGAELQPVLYSPSVEPLAVIPAGFGRLRFESPPGRPPSV